MWLAVLFDILNNEHIIDSNYTRVFNKKFLAEKYCDKLNKKFHFNDFSEYFYIVKEIKKGKE